ncbi:hypothetical protein HDU93_003368 [Gonapodya sp. JEL0774]|nr:hypothetical protein HDU93_003368 [Gonapodya sp. JEL0774]
MAREGAQVAISDLPEKEKDGKAVVAMIEAEGGKAIWVPLDVRTEEAWDAAITEVEARLGVLDVLVTDLVRINNAVYDSVTEPAIGGAENLTLEQWKATQAVCTEGVFLGHKYAIRSMKKNEATEWCSIVNISSRAGMVGIGWIVSYSTAKWAVRGMSKCFADLCSQKGYKIRCNSVHPGLIRTDATRRAGMFTEDDVPLNQELEKGNLVKRSGSVTEVANLVLFLASDESSFANAAEFVVDGGGISR